MRRQFLDTPLTPSQIEDLATVGLKGPSAGFTQGIEYLVLTSQTTRRDLLDSITTPGWLKDHPTHANLPRAPLMLVPLIDKNSYYMRYRQPDKQGSGLADATQWPLPYWFFDSGASVMLVLLKAVDLDLGACYIGIYRGSERLRQLFDIPHHLLFGGVICVGHTDLQETITGSPKRRARKEVHSQIHWDRYGSHDWIN